MGARFVTVLPSGSRGTTTTPASGGGFSSHGASALIMTVDTTVGAGTSLSVKLQGFDPVSAKWFDLTDGTNVVHTQCLTTTQTQVAEIGVGITVKAPADAQAYQSWSTVVPGQVRVVSTVAGANPTFSVGLCFLP
jgi:hypothetical protein